MGEAKNCISCGRRMSSPYHFALGDFSKDYCIDCIRPDGTMQSFEEKKASLIAEIIKTQGLDGAAAEKAALAMMENQPAWKNRF
ncbi:MAG: AraC family transcriptional regulator [Clostridiales bacterium]|nr:AraC family transcriptional regulator [Clostridiales bacterium]